MWFRRFCLRFSAKRTLFSAKSAMNGSRDVTFLLSKKGPPWRATPCLYGSSCPRDSTPRFSGNAPPRISEPDNRNVKAKHLLAKRNLGLARARDFERADSLARANYIERAVSFARANYIGKADFFRQGTPYRKSDSPARAVHWRVRGSVLHDFPGGRPLAFTVLPALAIQRLPFPAKRNGGGSSLWCRLTVPRARTQPRSTHHHSVWPPSDNETPTHFRIRQP